jgi:hypothetical protein
MPALRKLGAPASSRHFGASRMAALRIGVWMIHNKGPT